MNMSIQLIGDKPPVAQGELYRHVYRAAGARVRLNRTINEAYIRDHIEMCELRYHPFWLAKTMVMADRPPFPPRKLPNMIFVDAVSGYRGVFSRVPPIRHQNINQANLVQMYIAERSEAERYVKHVQEKQINRSYILKKPRHDIKDLSPVYLPLWKVVVRGEAFNGTYYINGNTGESEKFMAERWQSGKDLLPSS